MKKIQSEYDDLCKYKDDVGNIYYYKKYTDIIHNPYGPAVYHKASSWEDEYIEYAINGKRHRLDGPAKIYDNGEVQYWIEGNFVSNKKEKFYNDIKDLRSKTINKQNKIDVLNIKNCILNGLNSDTINILKFIL